LIIYGLVGYFAYLQVSLGPVVPFLRREHDLDFTTASLHFSAFAAGALVVGLFADRVASRYGRRLGLWGGGAGMAGGAVAIALGPSAP
jgi:MFS family permease